MLDTLKKSLTSLGRVFSKIKYVILALVFGFLFYLLNFIITALDNITSFYRIQGLTEIAKFTYTLFINFKGGILLSSFISMIVLSFLTGLLFSLVLYKVNLRKNISSDTSILGGIGMFLSIFAPGCAACGLGLAAFFGLTAGLATLPLKGLEISILAMIILIISIFKFSYNLFDDACSIDFHNRKTERRLNKKV